MEGQKKKPVWYKTRAEVALAPFSFGKSLVIAGAWPRLHMGSTVCFSCSLLMAHCRYCLFCYRRSAPCEAGEVSGHGVEEESWSRCSMGTSRGKALL